MTKREKKLRSEYGQWAVHLARAEDRVRDKVEELHIAMQMRDTAKVGYAKALKALSKLDR